MTCKELAGACDMEFHAETFDEMAKVVTLNAPEGGQAAPPNPMDQQPAPPAAGSPPPAGPPTGAPSPVPPMAPVG